MANIDRWNKVSAIGTIAAAFVGIIGMGIGWYYSYQNTKLTKSALELTNQQIIISKDQIKNDAKKRIEDDTSDSRKSRRDSERFERQMEQQKSLAQANLEFVRKQNDLIKKEVNLYEKQLNLVGKQNQFTQNELNIRYSEGYFKLQRMVDEVYNSGLFKNDSLASQSAFANRDSRIKILDNIWYLLFTEQNNISLLNNDTLRHYWLQLYNLTRFEGEDYDEKQNTTYQLGNKVMKNESEIEEYKLNSFYLYGIKVKQLLFIFGLKLRLKLTHPSILTESQKYEDNKIEKELIEEKKKQLRIEN